MRRAGLIAGSIIVGGAAAALIWYQFPEQARFYTDADTIHQPADAATPRDILWRPPIPLSEVLNTTDQDYEPRLSWDGLTLYFVRGKAGENADIYSARLTPAGWTEPRSFEAINTASDELGPEPSPDDRSLYFYSDRPGGSGGYDLWVVHRGESGWQTPLNLGPAVNSEFNDYGPAVTPDGRTLYFASNRPRPGDMSQPDPNAWPATVREDLFHRTYDLYTAALADAGPRNAEPLAALNTPHNEGAPCVSPAGDFLYFASDRPGGEGAFDVYRSRRLRGRLETPTNLGTPVNTRANELDPGLTHLGYALYFSSDRADPSGDATRPGDYNLYFTTAREVFTEVEHRNRPPIDWAALLRDILPFVLWLLLALLILLLLRALMGSMKNRRLSLITRCLIASLLAHALLMLLLGFWHVSASLSDILRHGGIQVALGSPAQAADLASQVRGQLTAINMPEPLETEAGRATTRIESESLEATVRMEIARVDTKLRERPPWTSAPGDAPDPARELAAPSPTPMVADPTPLGSLALPTETHRIESSEPDADIQPFAREASPLRRADITFATTQPVQPPVTVSVEPQCADAPDPQPMSTAFATARETSEADAQTPLAPPPSPRAALAEPITLAVSLPTQVPPPKRQPPVQARSVDPAAPVPVRARLAGATDALQAHATLATIAPDAETNRVVDDTESGPSDAPAAPDASVHATNLPRLPDRAADRVIDRALELELPALAQATGTSKAETAQRIQPAGPASARRPLAETALSTAPEGLSVQLDPVAAGHREPQPVVSAHQTTPITDAAVRSVPALPTRLHPTEPELALSLDLPSPTESTPDRYARTGAADASSGRPPAGKIHGRITDARTGDPLPDATVRLELPDGEPALATSDEDGRFTLPVPRLPDHVALTASHAGYVPTAVDVPARRLRRSALTQDFALEPETDAIIALEDVPEVHHLGNDRWEGRINSQFQRRAEGSILHAYIELSAEQVPPNVNYAAIALMAKGVQCPHRLYVNGYLLDRRLDESPPDGSFGEFTAEFNPALLIEGPNILEIRAVRCRGDLDDFELVNVRLRLGR